MTLYFSSNNIPELAKYNLKQRQAILTIAALKFSAPEKFIINIVKLAMLIPLFLYIAALNGVLIAVSIAGIIAGYFFIMRPIVLMFSHKHLAYAINKFESNK
ncbi:MAG: hypothetical protein HRT37_24010 [Alteromonadaceae bacterium]|nr:hypothetical protein [Alteromonadaceae bacterium]